MASPYERVGRRLVEMGYPVIPIIPSEKRPGRYVDGRWQGMSDWSQYCDRVPTEDEVSEFETWPDAGVCMPLGGSSKLIAIDLDHGSPEVRHAIESMMPPSPVQKKGAKGYTAFYRVEGTPPPSRIWKVNKQSVIELLSQGRQTVLPPTIHPEGMPYQWRTPDTLENYDWRDLPELPADFSARIDAALKPFQTHDDRVEVERANRPQWEGSDEGDSMWRELNNTALSCLEFWVPKLFPMLPPGRPPNGQYRVVAHWRGGEKPNVSIDPRGIRDWAAGSGHTPLDLIMLSEGMDLKDAEKWLRQAIGLPEPGADIDLENFTVGGRKLSDFHEDCREVYEAATTVTPVPLALPSKREVADLDPRFFEIGGVGGDLYDLIMDTAMYPQPVIAVAAVMVSLGVLMGRRYASEFGNNRTNIYGVGVAPSASGKDHPFSVIERVFSDSGLNHFLGGSTPASSAGLLSALGEGPKLYWLDEIHVFFRNISSKGGKTASHNADLFKRITELYSRSGGTLRGNDYGTGASVKREDAPKRRDIVNPMLGIFGTSTPIEFYSTINADTLADGSIARFMIFRSQEDLPQRNDEAGYKIPTASTGLVEALRAIAGVGEPPPPPNGEGADLRGYTSDGTTAFSPKIVPLTQEARDYMRVVMNDIDQNRRDCKGTFHDTILGRIMQNAIRLALIRSVSRNWVEPVTTADDLHWGVIVARSTAQSLIYEAEERVVESDYEGYFKRVLRMVKGFGVAGMPVSQFNKKIRFMKEIDKKHVINGLMAENEIRLYERPTKGRTNKSYVHFDFFHLITEQAE